MFKNMKIPVENNLDEIVVELERRGYWLEHRTSNDVSCVATFEDGAYHLYEGDPIIIFKGDEDMIKTTLAELKEM